MAPITLSRKERGVSEIRAAERTAMAALYGAATSRTGVSGANETAPSIAEGAERASQLIGEAAKSVDYWRGRQEGLLAVMEHIAVLQQQAAAMQGQAITAQREIIAGTSPTPVPPELAATGARTVLGKQARGTAKQRGRVGRRRPKGEPPEEAP